MVRRVLGIFFVLMASCLAARAEGLLRKDHHPSIVLGRDFPFLVYLPEGYQRGDLRYPVLYLLHGAGGDELAWTIDGGIKATADRLMRNGDIPPAIIVMPGCKACWWVDGAVEKAETAFWSELVPEIERRYRTIAERRGRLVAGLSAGGYGAVRFAMTYPDKIAAVAALSPAVYANVPPEISAARVQSPFLRKDGTFDEASWRARNYPSLLDRYRQQDKRVAFFLVSGDNDRYGIAFETVALFSRLYGHQPELAELRIVDGDHSWTIWANSIEPAMRYMFRHAARPLPVLMVQAGDHLAPSLAIAPGVGGVGQARYYP